MWSRSFGEKHNLREKSAPRRREFARGFKNNDLDSRDSRGTRIKKNGESVGLLGVPWRENATRAINRGRE